MTLVASFALTLLLLPLCFWLASKRGGWDRVRSTVPRLGGVAVGIAVLAFGQSPYLLGAVLVWMVGLVDDIRPLQAIQKLTVHLLAGAIAIYYGATLGGSAWLALLWIVGLTNAMNLSDGVDGLATGMALLMASAVLVLGGSPTLLIPLIGALLAFWLFNWHPASIFLGDSGAYLIGYILAVSSLTLPWWALACIFCVPIADTTLALLRRRTHWASPDLCHVHHWLLRRLTPLQTSTVLYLVTLVGTWIALGFAV